MLATKIAGDGREGRVAGVGFREGDVLLFDGGASWLVSASGWQKVVMASIKEVSIIAEFMPPT